MILECEAVVADVMGRAEINQAARLAWEAGFRVQPPITEHVTVVTRVVNGWFDLIRVFDDGHTEGIRQRADTGLWLPDDPAGDMEWMTSGDGPLQVITELLALPT